MNSLVGGPHPHLVGGLGPPPPLNPAARRDERRRRHYVFNMSVRICVRAYGRTGGDSLRSACP